MGAGNNLSRGCCTSITERTTPITASRSLLSIVRSKALTGGMAAAGALARAPRAARGTYGRAGEGEQSGAGISPGLMAGKEHVSQTQHGSSPAVAGFLASGGKQQHSYKLYGSPLSNACACLVPLHHTCSAAAASPSLCCCLGNAEVAPGEEDEGRGAQRPHARVTPAGARICCNAHCARAINAPKRAAHRTPHSHRALPRFSATNRYQHRVTAVWAGRTGIQTRQRVRSGRTAKAAKTRATQALPAAKAEIPHTVAKTTRGDSERRMA